MGYTGGHQPYIHSNGLGIFLLCKLDRYTIEMVIDNYLVELIHEQAFWFRQKEEVDQNWIQHRY